MPTKFISACLCFSFIACQPTDIQGVSNCNRFESNGKTYEFVTFFSRFQKKIHSIVSQRVAPEGIGFSLLNEVPPYASDIPINDLPTRLSQTKEKSITQVNQLEAKFLEYARSLEGKNFFAGQKILYRLGVREVSGAVYWEDSAPQSSEFLAWLGVLAEQGNSPNVSAPISSVTQNIIGDDPLLLFQSMLLPYLPQEQLAYGQTQAALGVQGDSENFCEQLLERRSFEIQMGAIEYFKALPKVYSELSDLQKKADQQGIQFALLKLDKLWQELSVRKEWDSIAARLEFLERCNLNSIKLSPVKDYARSEVELKKNFQIHHIYCRIKELEPRLMNPYFSLSATTPVSTSGRYQFHMNISEMHRAKQKDGSEKTSF